MRGTGNSGKRFKPDSEHTPAAVLPAMPWRMCSMPVAASLSEWSLLSYYEKYAVAREQLWSHRAL